LTNFTGGKKLNIDAFNKFFKIHADEYKLSVEIAKRHDGFMGHCRNLAKFKD